MTRPSCPVGGCDASASHRFEEASSRIAKIRRGIARLRDGDRRPFSRGELFENRRQELEDRGFPEGPDYEALILEEDEEW